METENCHGPARANPDRKRTRFSDGLRCDARICRRPSLAHHHVEPVRAIIVRLLDRSGLHQRFDDALASRFGRLGCHW